MRKILSISVICILLSLAGCGVKISEQPEQAARQFCERMETAASENNYDMANTIVKDFIDAFPEKDHEFYTEVLYNFQQPQYANIAKFMSDVDDLSKYPEIKDFMLRIIIAHNIDNPNL